MLNEFRFGLRRGRLDNLQAWDHPQTGADARNYMGFVAGPGGPESLGGTPFRINTVLFEHNAIINETNGSVGNTSPLWTYADNISWTRGAHGFKGGAEFRYGNGDAWNSDEIIPAVQLGPRTNAGALGDYYCPACGIPITGISTTSIPGLHALDEQRVRDLLADLSGSVANISQAFSLKPDPKNITWLDYPNYYKKYRDFHQNEWMAFFKDDWKVTNDLTLNLGVRWEWFGVPYEAHGMMARPKDGNLFGLSGSSFADWYKPGERGTLTTTEFVGKYSPNPATPLYNNDWNNFAPAVGFSWSLPWFGTNKTVLRGGYGVNYQGSFAGGGLLGVDINVGTAPGVNHYANHPTTKLSELNMANVVLPIPERYPNGFLPVVSVTERNQGIVAFDIHQRSPYAQNFNLELQRELVRNLTLEVRYVATKGTKLTGMINIDSPIIVENGLMEALRTTREGGDAPLFDRMLKGLNFAGIGTVGVNGLSGSSALRRFSSTRANIANGNLGGVASYLNTNSSFTGVVGGMLRNGGLPENFIVANPQYSSANISANMNNSTYHSMQSAVTKRLSHGFTSQMTYTWSRSLGTAGNIDPRNRQLNKSLLTTHRTHDIRMNGTWQLPFGTGQALLNNAPGWVSRVIEGWQFGGIASWTSGAPLTITAGENPLGGASQFPDIVGDFPKNIGKLTSSNTAGQKDYLSGLQRVTDPGRAAVTNADSLNASYGRFAIVDASGKILLQHAAFGTIGNMGQNWIQGPGTIGFDLNLLKRVRIAERKTFILRVDAVNFLNHPNWGSPVVNMNLATFGLVPLPATGNRQFTFNMRMEF
ncbi:MAG: hypothetical protein DMG14_04490 [Acidobacteria bacterium]|nr:MAG: hypothetical protein DMG14_04490 [Acidobacteriota bacterium]